jgi:3-isopropylmalate/(R)-2-methylmalate dehydratase small subunit
MNVPRFDRLTGRAALLGADDVDTDQIIPARFLKVIDRAGLGAALFADYRRSFPDGFPLDRPDAAGAPILIAGRNFGCGSSREHAPWALVGAGYRAIIARSFADIFRGNAQKNGLLPVALTDPDHAALFAAHALAPRLEVTIDLHSCEVTFGGHSAPFAIEPFARRCLLDGVDELGYLQAQLPAIAAWERATEASS